MIDAAYDSSAIGVLEGLEPVRKRPGMYIGSTDREGLHHLVWEIIDNAVDEAMAGFCDEINVSLNGNGSVTIQDNGRGIPVDIHAEKGVSAATLVFTLLHAGGKFGGGAYKTSGGLHGVGASVTNALSEYLNVTIFKDGGVYKQSFSQGNEDGPLVRVRDMEEGELNGTSVTFKPDPVMFEEAIEETGDLAFDPVSIAERMKRTAYLIKGLRLVLVHDGEEKVFHSENGLLDMLDDIRDEDKSIHVPLYQSEKDGDVEVEFAFVYENRFQKHINSFVNNIYTHDGGSHEQSFIRGVTAVLNTYAHEILNIGKKFTFEDITEGLSAVLSVRIPEPKFSGQTKHKLVSREAGQAVYGLVKEHFGTYLEENAAVAAAIIKKIEMSLAAREAAQKSREKVRRAEILNSVGTLPGKLADCQTKDLERSEVYIVEGDSAGGSAKQGRDRFFQAILPLKGKILNAGKADLDRLEGSAEVAALTTALGTRTGNDFNMENLRYGKIIIMTDADVDGSHIAVLLLTFFLKRMPELLSQGRVYLATPPLFRAKKQAGGGEVRYYATEPELKEDFPHGTPKGWDVSRFKGLGEMSPEQLWETTMNPETRILQRIQFDPDNEEAAYATFEMLMGKEVPPRRQFIESEAKHAYISI